jgi:hypothetical protein
MLLLLRAISRAKRLHACIDPRNRSACYVRSFSFLKFCSIFSTCMSLACDALTFLKRCQHGKIHAMDMRQRQDAFVLHPELSRGLPCAISVGPDRWVTCFIVTAVNSCWCGIIMASPLLFLPGLYGLLFFFLGILKNSC